MANYVGDDALIRRLFDETFDELKAAAWAGPEWASLSAAAVQAGYFAEKRRKGGATEVLDSVSGASAADEGAYELIMRQKERLLSFDEPVSFIFSHSALKEGWDSPNVFQICTLKQTGSELRKRQEIGRGVRLAVNQDGERVADEQVNVLTVIANESYETYVAKLQTEIVAERLAATARRPSRRAPVASAPICAQRCSAVTSSASCGSASNTRRATG